MTKYVHYALTTSLWQDGVNAIVRRTIKINNDDILFEIIKDINANGITRIRDKCCSDECLELDHDGCLELGHDSVGLHYWVQSDNNVILQYRDDANKLSDYYLLSKESSDNLLENNDSLWTDKDSLSNDKIIHLIIAFEEFYNDSYPNYEIDKVCVKTFEEFSNIIKNKLIKIKSKTMVQSSFIHYIVEGEINGTWRKFT